MPRIQLPEGARAVDSSGRYTARPGDQVTVSPGHAAAIHRYAQRRPTGDRHSFGTRISRWCATCRRLWNAWNTTCPRCGAETSLIEPGG